MKAFATLAVFCLIAGALATQVELTEEQKAKAKVYFDECLKQENISETEANQLRRKDFYDVTRKMLCFGTCFMEHVGYLKDNEVQNADVIISKLGAIIGEEKTKTVLEKCKDIKIEERCDTGFNFYECFESENPIKW